MTLANNSKWRYHYDALGQVTGSMRAAAYSAANSVNQYPGRNVPGAVDVVGEANASARVLVNFQPVNRHGEYYLVWGLDLSGSMQGAVGVGGLLTIRDHVTGVNYAVEYELIPGPSYTSYLDWNEFNLNSYVSGLIKSFGYAPPPSGSTTPGYDKPVPDFVYTKSFSSTKNYKIKWKLQYPGF